MAERWTPVDGAKSDPSVVGVSTCSNVIQGVIDELHQRYSPLLDGAPADYIPELAKADPSDFGIVIATVDGRLYSVGDTDKSFTIQSISKPFVYGLALKLLSPERMVTKVGVEPSGEAFNAISLDPDTGRPRNPMINAGAIASTAQIACHDPEHAEDQVLDFFAELAGRRLAVDEAVYRSERETGHRNRSIGHLLRNFNIIESDPEPALDLYFRQCSIQVSCRDLAVMAATLACQGRNPFTGAQPLSPAITTRVLALMASCGTYDFAGQWLHDVGMPAKSGVGGGILAVVPGRLGIAIYSPPLDALGNSVRGIAVCNELSERLGLSLFSQYPQSTSTVRRSYAASLRQSRRWRSPRDLEALRNSGNAIRVVHVQGILEFAALERLVAELIGGLRESRVLMLDLAHVIELPQESRLLLAEQLLIFRRQGLAILLSRCSHLDLEELQTTLGKDGESIFCGNLDQAIERAEDLYLASLELGGASLRSPSTLSRTSVSLACWNPITAAGLPPVCSGVSSGPANRSLGAVTPVMNCSSCVLAVSPPRFSWRMATATCWSPGWPRLAPACASARSPSSRARRARPPSVPMWTAVAWSSPAGPSMRCAAAIPRPPTPCCWP